MNMESYSRLKYQRNKLAWLGPYFNKSKLPWLKYDSNHHKSAEKKSVSEQGKL